MEHVMRLLAAVQDATLRAKAEREIDSCMLMALIKLHPDPSAVRKVWRAAAVETTSNRVLLAAAQDELESAQAISSQGAQERIRYWERVLDARLADDPSS